MIEFKGECGHTIRAKDDDAGKVVRCSYCGKEAQVPEEEDELDFLLTEVERTGDFDPPKSRRRAKPRPSAAAGPPIRPKSDFNPFGVALKMCYAALTKGFTALCTELLTAAAALGVSAPLTAELEQSQASFYKQMSQSIPGMPSKARRWVGEMEEIAQTFDQLGLTPQILAGAADLYRFVSATPLAERTPEDTSPLPTLAETVHSLAEQLHA